jgi:AraC-like DNA-binding protein
MTAATLPIALSAAEVQPRDAVSVRHVDAFGGFDVMRATYAHHSFPPHFHTTFAIGVMTRGACALECRGATYLLRAGYVVLLAPGEVHTGEQVGHDGWSNRVVYPSANVVDSALADGWGTPSRSLRFQSPVVDDAALSGQIVQRHRALEESESLLEQEAHTIELLATAFGTYSEPWTNQARRHTAGMAAARDYLHAHFTEAVTLTRLAEIAGLSCFYFLRLFRVAFGVTPHVYLALLRLERARALLRTDSPIAQTAVTSGFSDQSHLTRFFKRVYGVTPGVYARAVQRRG